MNLLNRKDEYYINIINEQNITKSIENLSQKNEYDSVAISGSCQCSTSLKTIHYSPELFREYLEKNSNQFHIKCHCNKEYRIFNISLSTLSYELQVEYFTNFMNENVYKIIDYLREIKYTYRVCAIWSCQSCGYSNEQEKFFNFGSFERNLKRAKDFSWVKCLKCYNKCQISSFHLLNTKSNMSEELCSITGIVRHLIDKDKYQVYGYWFCRVWKCRHEIQCKTGLICRYKWHSQHKWQCQHEPKCNGLWSMSKCRNEECICQKKRVWKCQDLLPNKDKWRCEDKFCRCQQRHDFNCEEIWINKNKWQCQHDQKCKDERQCQRDWLCLNEWKSEKYTQELLKEYLKKSPNEQHEFFRKYCTECREMCQITSFHLHTFQENKDENEESNNSRLAPIPVDNTSLLESTSPSAEKLAEIQSQIPTVEIICHLVWNNHYRVFGKWTCENCYRFWPSSYTWIKLHKFIDKTPVANLNRTDFYMQSCNDCKQSGNSLLNYEHLQESLDSNHHKRDLCKKCRYGEFCHKTGNYFG